LDRQKTFCQRSKTSHAKSLERRRTMDKI